MKTSPSLLLLASLLLAPASQATEIQPGAEVACYISGRIYNKVKEVTDMSAKEDIYLDFDRYELARGAVKECQKENASFELRETNLKLSVKFSAPCRSNKDQGGFRVELTDGKFNYLTLYRGAADKSQAQAYMVSEGRTYDLQVLCLAKSR